MLLSCIAVLAPLAEAGFVILAYDTQGHGQSGPKSAWLKSHIWDLNHLVDIFIDFALESRCGHYRSHGTIPSCLHMGDLLPRLGGFVAKKLLVDLGISVDFGASQSLFHND